MRDAIEACRTSGNSPPTAADTSIQANAPAADKGERSYRQHMADGQIKFVREAEAALLAVWCSVDITRGHAVGKDFEGFWHDFRTLAREVLGIDTFSGEGEDEDEEVVS